MPAAAANSCRSGRRRWRFDYAWPEFSIAFEREGGTFCRVPGRHTRGAGYRDCDEKRTEQAVKEVEAIFELATPDELGMQQDSIIDPAATPSSQPRTRVRN